MRSHRTLTMLGCGALFGTAMALALPADPPAASGAARTGDHPATADVPLTDQVLIYRGDLSWRGTPWSGVADLEFRLFASPTGTDRIGAPVLAPQWPVTDGEVLVGLDFGVTDPSALVDGAWMEVSVNGTILSPRRFIPALGWSLSPGRVGGEGARRAMTVDPDLVNDLLGEQDATDDRDDRDSDGTGGSLGGQHRGEGGGGTGGAGHGGAGGSPSNPDRPGIPGMPRGGFGGSGGGSGEGGEGEMGFGDGGGWQLGSGFVWTLDRVGIGTQNPNSGTQLHVVSNKFKTLWVRNTNAARHAIFSNSGLIYLEGNVGLGVQNPSERLHLVGGTGRFENSATTGIAVLGQSLATTGSTVAGQFQNSSTGGRAVVGEALASTGGTYGGSFISQSNAGVGVQGFAGASTGSTVGVNGKVLSTSGTAVSGEALATTGFTTGVLGMSNSTQGRGVYGVAVSSTGNTIGVLGQVSSPTGFAGYFTGPAGSRNYFERNVGIGTEIPLAELHVANVSGNADLLIKRNDATHGFNLGVSGTPTKLFMARTDGTTFTDIMTLDGSTDRVGIGTTSPDSRLDVRGFANEDALRVRVDGATKFRVYSNGGVAIGSNPTTVPQNGLLVQGRLGVGVEDPQSPIHAVSTQTTQFSSAIYGLAAPASTTFVTVGVHGEATDDTGFGVYGVASAGVGGAGTGGYFLSEGDSGRGLYAAATSATGDTMGAQVHGFSPNTTVIQADSWATTGTARAMRATTRSPGGIGIEVRNFGDSGDAIALRASTSSATGYAGYFTGPTGSKNYFAQSVGIGVLNPTFQLHLSTNSAAKPTSNTWTISSDARLKKNIQTIEHALDDLMALRGVTYQWIDPASQGGMTGTYTGLIAQEVEPIFPEWISEDAEGFKRLTVIGFEGIVIEALRELRAEKDVQIAQRDAAIEQLRSEKDGEIADLRARLERLEKHLLRSGPASE